MGAYWTLLAAWWALGWERLLWLWVGLARPETPRLLAADTTALRDERGMSSTAAGGDDGASGGRAGAEAESAAGAAAALVPPRPASASASKGSNGEVSSGAWPAQLASPLRGGRGHHGGRGQHQHPPQQCHQPYSTSEDTLSDEAAASDNRDVEPYAAANGELLVPVVCGPCKGWFVVQVGARLYWAAAGRRRLRRDGLGRARLLHGWQ